MPFRYVYMVILSILTVGLLFLTDPDTGLIQGLPIGAQAVATLTMLSVAVLFVSLLHISRRALFDYIDLGELVKQAAKGPAGAGLVFLGVCVAMVAISVVIAAATL